MKYVNKLIVLLAVIIAFVSLGGCISLNKKYVAQQQYALMVKMPQAQHQRSRIQFAKVLEIYYPQINAQFSGANFVYRTSCINYIKDYYNMFFYTPEVQIHQAILSYLQVARVAKYVTDQPYPLQANYVLKTNITKLYADYRDPKLPRAVIAIQFILVNQSEHVKILLDKTYQEEIVLTRKSSEALVYAWSKGLNKILAQFTCQLHKAL